jgi:hypothetical protein
MLLTYSGIPGIPWIPVLPKFHHQKNCIFVLIKPGRPGFKCSLFESKCLPALCRK